MSLTKLRNCSVRWWVGSVEGAGQNAEGSCRGIAWSLSNHCPRYKFEPKVFQAQVKLESNASHCIVSFVSKKQQFTVLMFCLLSFQPHDPVISVTGTFGQLTPKRLFPSWHIFFRWRLVLMWTQQNRYWSTENSQFARNSSPWRKSDMFCAPRMRGELWNSCFMQI
jgi:hypothetical protein